MLSAMNPRGLDLKILTQVNFVLRTATSSVLLSHPNCLKNYAEILLAQPKLISHGLALTSIDD